MKVDDSAWPLVVATMPASPGMADLDVLQRYFQGCFARGERFAMISDSRAIRTIPDAVWRKHLVEWMNDPAFRRKNARWNVGSATVMSSAAVRAALTALQWLWKPPSPQYYTGTMPDAISWCVAQLEAAQVPISPELSALQAPLSRRAVGER